MALNAKRAHVESSSADQALSEQKLQPNIVDVELWQAKFVNRSWYRRKSTTVDGK